MKYWNTFINSKEGGKKQRNNRSSKMRWILKSWKMTDLNTTMSGYIKCKKNGINQRWNSQIRLKVRTKKYVVYNRDTFNSIQKRWKKMQMKAWKPEVLLENTSQNRHQNKYYSRQKGTFHYFKRISTIRKSDKHVCLKTDFQDICMKMIELKAETDKATTIVRDSTTTFPGTNRPI